MKRGFGLIIGLMACVAMMGQIRGNSVVVTVEPDHQDWRYNTGEKATYTIEVRQEGTLMKNVAVD